MDGLMMDFPLTLSTIFRRAEQLFGRREIVSRLPDDPRSSAPPSLKLPVPTVTFTGDVRLAG